MFEHYDQDYILPLQNQLEKMDITMEDILLKCQEAIHKQGKKKGQVNQVLKRIALISRYLDLSGFNLEITWETLCSNSSERIFQYFGFTVRIH
jgi:hypothetical protein